MGNKNQNKQTKKKRKQEQNDKPIIPLSLFCVVHLLLGIRSFHYFYLIAFTYIYVSKSVYIYIYVFVFWSYQPSTSPSLSAISPSQLHIILFCDTLSLIRHLDVVLLEYNLVEATYKRNWHPPSAVISCQ